MPRRAPALLFRGGWDLVDDRAGMLSATSLSFVLTATDIGARIGKLRDINATALVGAAVLAMLIFPLGAQSLLAERSAGGRSPDPGLDGSEPEKERHGRSHHEAVVGEAPAWPG